MRVNLEPPVSDGYVWAFSRPLTAHIFGEFSHLIAHYQKSELAHLIAHFKKNEFAPHLGNFQIVSKVIAIHSGYVFYYL